jgi:PilZ domain-containing protein
LSTTQPFSELRGTRRITLALPVAVRLAETPVTELMAQTKDVSARGIYFYVDSHIQPGSRIEFVITLPPEITMTEQIRVRCAGRVLRVETPAPGKMGVAAAIEQYEFLPAE